MANCFITRRPVNNSGSGYGGVVHLTTDTLQGKNITGTDGTNVVTGKFDANGEADINVPTDGPWTFDCDTYNETTSSLKFEVNLSIDISYRLKIRIHHLTTDQAPHDIIVFDENDNQIYTTTINGTGAYGSLVTGQGFSFIYNEKQHTITFSVNSWRYTYLGIAATTPTTSLSNTNFTVSSGNLTTHWDVIVTLEYLYNEIIFVDSTTPT